MHGEIPEIAGVRIPSPITMHMPSIAIKSNNLLATTLFLKNLASLLCFSVPSSKRECERLELEFAGLEERIPIFMFLQSNEYKAKVPPAMNQCSTSQIIRISDLDKHISSAIMV